MKLQQSKKLKEVKSRVDEENVRGEEKLNEREKISRSFVVAKKNVYCDEVKNCLMSSSRWWSRKERQSSSKKNKEWISGWY